MHCVATIDTAAVRGRAAGWKLYTHAVLACVGAGHVETGVCPPVTVCAERVSGHCVCMCTSGPRAYHDTKWGTVCACTHAVHWTGYQQWRARCTPCIAVARRPRLGVCVASGRVAATTQCTICVDSLGLFFHPVLQCWCVMRWCVHALRGWPVCADGCCLLCMYVCAIVRHAGLWCDLRCVRVLCCCCCVDGRHWTVCVAGMWTHQGVSALCVRVHD